MKRILKKLVFAAVLFFFFPHIAGAESQFSLSFQMSLNSSDCRGVVFFTFTRSPHQQLDGIDQLNMNQTPRSSVVPCKKPRVSLTGGDESDPDDLYMEKPLAYGFQAAGSEIYCRKFIFTRSSHGGNLFNRFQEHNTGFAVECKTHPDDITSTIMGVIDPNSRDGRALFYGKTARYYLPEVMRISFYAGLEVVALWYEYNDMVGYNRVMKAIPPALTALALHKSRNAEQGSLIAVVPIAIIGVRLRLPENLGYVSIEQRDLGGLARLKGFATYGRAF